MTTKPNVRKNLKALVLAIFASGIALSSTTYAADRAQHHHYARHFHSTSQQYPWYINEPGEPGYGPAPTGQYRSFEMLDHFPGNDRR